MFLNVVLDRLRWWSLPFFSTVDYMPFMSIGGIVHVMFSVIFSGFNILVVSSFIQM